jgi:hypothetical protein
MQIKTTFILLLAIYVISVITNSLKSNGSVGHFALPLILMGILFVIYSALSVFLTMKVSKTGAFDWISSNPSIRNIALVIGLLSVLYTVFTAGMIKLDWTTYQYQSIANLKDFMAFTAYIWVPLLMIIPYGLWVFKTDSIIHPGLIFKVPIIINVLIGIAIYAYFNFGMVKAISGPKQSDQDYYIQRTIDRIHNERHIMDILFYTRPDNDKKIVNAAFSKMSSLKGWQQELEVVLQNCDNMRSITEVYHFLSAYFIENPETMVAPFEKSLDCLAAYAQKLADNTYTSPNDLHVLHIDKMLAAIEKQFSEREDVINRLSILEEALNGITREDFKTKTKDLIRMIESFKEKIK